jgi:endonuclease YncB( thermonuclease family)
MHPPPSRPHPRSGGGGTPSVPRKILFIKTFVFIILFSSFSNAASAADLIVTKIISGDELILSDGRDVKLEGIKAPGADRPEFEKQARDLLHKLTQDSAIILGDVTTDRYGRSSAQIYALPKDGKKLWLQGEMLQAGMTFVYPPTGNETNLAEMQKAETTAYQAKRGIWADAAYADLPAGNPDDIPYGQFAFVSGKVIKAERVKNKFYLNFGDDWHTDFTVQIAAHDMHFFKKADIDPADYAGKTIRVRGWVIRDFGPMITVTHPTQIELLTIHQD